MTGKQTVKETLISARAIIADPAHWTTGEYARSKSGRGVHPWSKTACQFCILGALEKASGRRRKAFSVRQRKAFHAARLALSEEVCRIWGVDSNVARLGVDSNVARFNDHYDHTTVLEVFDRAIALAPDE